jgi:hypothetical protein
MSAFRFVVPMIFAAGVGIGVAVAPIAAADPNPNPLLPQCEVTGGSAVIGGQTTDCASPGNVQIDATPPVPGYGMFPWDDEFFVL